MASDPLAFTQMDRLIVDGYNVIFAWPELAALKEVSLQDAREALVDILADYAALTKQRVTVVFDSHRGGEQKESRERVHGVEVIYSGRRTSADHVIERLVYEARPGEDMTVATSDAVQRDLVLGKQVKTMSALIFKSEVEAVMARRDAAIRERKDRSDLARRLEDRLDPRTRERLERLRRNDSQ